MQTVFICEHKGTVWGGAMCVWVQGSNTDSSLTNHPKPQTQTKNENSQTEYSTNILRLGWVVQPGLRRRHNTVRSKPVKLK